MVRACVSLSPFYFSLFLLPLIFFPPSLPSLLSLHHHLLSGVERLCQLRLAVSMSLYLSVYILFYLFSPFLFLSSLCLTLEAARELWLPGSTLPTQLSTAGGALMLNEHLHRMK